MFCKHDWEILDKTEFESIADRAARLCDNFKGHGNLTKVFGKTIVTILTCKKCGKLKRYKDIV